MERPYWKPCEECFSEVVFLSTAQTCQVPPADLVAYYCVCIRSSIDYACPVFHYALPKYFREDRERLQKRALSCIFPAISYSAALARANISSIHDRHDMLTKKRFKALMDNPDCKLKRIIPETKDNVRYNLRKYRALVVPRTKSKRFSNSFIISSCNDYNASNG